MIDITPCSFPSSHRCREVKNKCDLPHPLPYLPPSGLQEHSLSVAHSFKKKKRQTTKKNTSIFSLAQSPYRYRYILQKVVENGGVSLVALSFSSFNRIYTFVYVFVCKYIYISRHGYGGPYLCKRILTEPMVGAATLQPAALQAKERERERGGDMEDSLLLFPTSSFWLFFISFFIFFCRPAVFSHV